MKHLDRIICGTGLILSAIIIVLQSFGILNASLELGSVIVFVVSVFILITGIARKNLVYFIIGACFMTLSALPIIGITDFPIWEMVCALAVGFTGLYWLVPGLINKNNNKSETQNRSKRANTKKEDNDFQSDRKERKKTSKKNKQESKQGRGNTTSRTVKGWYRLKNNFKKIEEFVEVDDIQSASIENNAGNVSVHFEKLIVMQEHLTIRVQNNFGTTTLYVPTSWNIDVEPSCLLGKVVFRKKPRKQFGINVNIVAHSNFGKIIVQWVEA